MIRLHALRGDRERVDRALATLSAFAESDRKVVAEQAAEES